MFTNYEYNNTLDILLNKMKLNTIKQNKIKYYCMEKSSLKT